MTSQAHPRGRSGFTLIELSIVLVVIGLIAGGILVGNDLINAAQIRAQISQIEKFSAAVNTFKAKYNALPGDMRNPSQFGLYQPTSSGGLGMGDGNGLIVGRYGGGYNYNGEVMLYWRHLSEAGLFDGVFQHNALQPISQPLVAST